MCVRGPEPARTKDVSMIMMIMMRHSGKSCGQAPRIVCGQCSPLRHILGGIYDSVLRMCISACCGQHEASASSCFVISRVLFTEITGCFFIWIDCAFNVIGLVEEGFETLALWGKHLERWIVTYSLKLTLVPHQPNRQLGLQCKSSWVWFLEWFRRYLLSLEEFGLFDYNNVK